MAAVGIALWPDLVSSLVRILGKLRIIIYSHQSIDRLGTLKWPCMSYP